MTTVTRYGIRWLIRRDLADVVRIDSESYARPWGEEGFLARLRQRNCVGYIAVAGDFARSQDIRGFMVIELFGREIRVVRLGVARAHRRQGVGTALIDSLKDKLSQQRRQWIRVTVSERNLSAHLFLRSQGFLAESVLRSEFGNGHDGYQFGFCVDDKEASHVGSESQEAR